MKRFPSNLSFLIGFIFLLYLFYLFLLLSQVEYNPTALADIGDQAPPYNPKVYGPNAVIWKDSVGYDGQFYYQIALHPFNLARYYQPKDEWTVAFRSQRILYPFLAFLFSFGKARIIPWMLIGINLGALVVSLWALAKLLADYEGNQRLLFFYAFSVAPLLSIRFDMTQLLALALILLAFFAYRKNQLWVASLFLALALLTHESSVLFLLVFIWQGIEEKNYRQLAILSTSLVPFFLWQIVLTLRFNWVPLSVSEAHLGLPFAGFFSLVAKVFSQVKALFLKGGGINFSSFQVGVLLSLILTIVFILFVFVVTFPSILSIRKSLWHKALLLQGLFAVFAGFLVNINFFDAARVFGGIFPFLVLAYAESRSRWLLAMLLTQLGFTIIFLLPIPNILHTYHDYTVLK